jgi:hypothetical protein
VLHDLPEQGMPEQAGQEVPHTLVGLYAVEERGEGGCLGVRVVGGTRDLGEQIGRVMRSKLPGAKVERAVVTCGDVWWAILGSNQ